MKAERWLRIIPVAIIMYTISFVDRTNVSLALDPKISTMMRDLAMDDRMKGQAAGIFFLGYILFQIPGGYLASRWSARKVIAILLVLWGISAVSCGLVTTYRQFEVARFMLGVAESGVFPATLVLLAHWFPREERARANAYWNLCLPMAVALSSPVTGWLLGGWGWQNMLMIEGALPFLWLPIWLYFISDGPGKARWISREEREHLEARLAAEQTELRAGHSGSAWQTIMTPTVFFMVVIYFFQNCASYGCMTFLTELLRNAGQSGSGLRTGILFGVPYIVTAIVMVVISRHSDRTQERRGHAALAYALGGTCLILSVALNAHSFWLSYALLCFAISGPFAAMSPFWAIPAETLPRGVLGTVMGLVNALGNVGGYAGTYVVGYLKQETNGIVIPFSTLAIGMLIGSALCFKLPKRKAAIARN